MSQIADSSVMAGEPSVHQGRADVPSSSAPNYLAYGVIAVASAILWLAVAAELMILAPKSQRLFDDFKIAIPWATDLVIHHFWWAVPAIAIAALGGCFAIRKQWAWNAALLVLPLLFNLIIIVSLYFPMLFLLDDLMGGGKK
jgi:hypothetical protein